MKKKYEKPEFKKVKLVPEDAVLTFCKAIMTAQNIKCAAPACTNRDQGS